jgi:hypothetical protein
MSVSNTKPNTVSNTVANAYTAGPLKPSGDHIYLPMSSGVHDPENLSDVGLVNREFLYWTADNPDGWTVVESGGNIVTQNGNACRIVSDGTLVSITQTLLTTGKQYRISFDVLDVAAGELYVVSGATIIGGYATTGRKEAVFVAADTYIQFKRRSGVTDVTFTNITITENLTTNGDFALWTDPTVPDGWIKFGTHDANNFVEESAGGCRVKSSGTFTGIEDSATTVGKRYMVSCEIIDDTQGTIQLRTGSTIIASLGSIGEFSYIFDAESTTVRISRGTACDITVDNFSVEEISARTLDVSGYGHHALLGDGSTVDTFPTKISGDGYLFDATDDRLYNATDLIGATDFTIGMVARIDSLGGGSLGRLIDNSQLLIYTSATGRITVSSDADVTSLNSALNAFAYGDIITVIVTRASSTVSIYINGFKNAVGSAGVPAVGSATYIGNNAAATRGLDGVVYNHVKVGVSYDEYAVKDLHQRLLADADIRG